MSFLDRVDAGRRLAEALRPYAGADPVVLALPRGGVPVAAEIAAALGAPLDLVLVRKLGTPGQPELAMGAIAERASPVVVWNEALVAALGIPLQARQGAQVRELAEIVRRRRLYLGDRPPVSVAGRTAIVVDDGLATGATMRAALRAVRAEGPRTLVLAVPVAPADTLEQFAAEADDVVCLETPAPFLSVGGHYRDFRQVEDREVTLALERAAAATRS